MTSYFIAGGTGAAGAANLSPAEQQMQITEKLICGLTLPELALWVGIIGTLTTMTLQFLNWRRLRKKDKESMQNKPSQPPR